MSTTSNPKIVVEWNGEGDKGAWKSTCPDLNLEVEAASIEDAIKGMQTAVSGGGHGSGAGGLEPLNGNPVG